MSRKKILYINIITSQCKKKKKKKHQMKYMHKKFKIINLRISFQ